MLVLTRRVGARNGRISNLGAHNPEITEGPADAGIETSIGEQNDKEVLFGINPDLGSCPPGMTVGRG
jgi:hypothetical protein